MTRQFAPVWRYAVSRSRKAARLTAEVRQLCHDLTAVRADLAVVTADRDALRSHFDLARSQRDGARDLLAAIAAEPCGPTDAEYAEFLKDCNERGPA